jgi:putative restriction endonuclease
MPADPVDGLLRLAAFAWLAEQVRLRGDAVLPRSLIAEGFRFRGERVPLVGPQGIFKPRLLPDLPLSITTSLSGPYDDSFGDEELLLYRYRGTDPRHPDNVRLRRAMELQVPLVYFHGVVEGKYLAVWPVFVVGDDPGTLTFRIAVDDAALASPVHAAEWPRLRVAEPEVRGRRAYYTASVRQRLHQRGFRERVLRAYREQCALCGLRHQELLDAAHIVPDTEPGGEPIVPNGLALCKLHHAAFDGNLLGIRPDHVVEVRPDVLRERDGPMLVHGLQQVHGGRLHAPRSRALAPDPDLLARRYERFREAV